MLLNTKKTAVFSLILAVFLFSLDRFLKSIALASQVETNLIGGWLKFNFAKNYYIAFSIPINGLILEVFISLIILVLFIYILKIAKKQEWLPLSLLTNILFGAISNLLDRLQYGYVVDYLDLKYFTIFNVADIMIVLGAILLSTIYFLHERRNKNQRI